MPHTHHPGFQLWEVAITAVLVFTAFLYMRGWIRIRRHEHDSVAGWRAASFFLGLFSIWLAMASPVSELDHEMLTVHMIQHLLLMTLIPPIIWLGGPGRVLLRGLPQKLFKVIDPLLCSMSVQRLRVAIAHPVVGWFAAAVTLIAWHIPSLFAFGMRSEIWHGIEQTSFLLAGLLFWRPVMCSWLPASNSSEWMMLLYLFLATLPCDILSGFLVFCDRVVYPFYFSSPRLFGLSALEDQQCAGALMWTCVTVVYFVAGAIWAARLLSPAHVRRAQAATSVSPKAPWAAEII